MDAPFDNLPNARYVASAERLISAAKDFTLSIRSPSSKALITRSSALRIDNNSNWTTIDVRALREHVVDMDRLIHHARVKSELINEQQIRYQVYGAGASSTNGKGSGPLIAIWLDRASGAIKRSRNAFVSTKTLDNDIAAAASTGDNISPLTG